MEKNNEGDHWWGPPMRSPFGNMMNSSKGGDEGATLSRPLMAATMPFAAWRSSVEQDIRAQLSWNCIDASTAEELRCAVARIELMGNSDEAVEASLRDGAGDLAVFGL